MTKETFARPYLLAIYNAALDHGHVKIQPIDQERALSLRQSLYRLRRRSDASHALFITPEMHLVTVGNWSPEEGGTLPIYYTTRPPDEEPLPNIVPGERSAIPAPVDLRTAEPTEQTFPQEPEADFDTEDFVERLRRNTHKDD